VSIFHLPSSNCLDRYAPRNENFVLVRSQAPEARSQKLHAELKAAGEHKHFADPFWLLASGFRIPPLFVGISRAKPLLSFRIVKLFWCEP
jgi:hypothetical protein